MIISVSATAAGALTPAGFATLLFDLLSVPEAQDRRNVFDISLLASRLQLAVEWLEVSHKLPSDFPLGFFGASTGKDKEQCALSSLIPDRQQKIANCD